MENGSSDAFALMHLVLGTVKLKVLLTTLISQSEAY